MSHQHPARASFWPLQNFIRFFLGLALTFF
jgi:hypothetical protein